MGDGSVAVAPMGIEAFGPIEFGDSGLNGGHVLEACREELGFAGRWKASLFCRLFPLADRRGPRPT